MHDCILCLCSVYCMYARAYFYKIGRLISCSRICCVQNMNEVEFRFSDQQTAMSTVTRMASSMKVG